MPQTLTIDSQVPDNLKLSLSWGKLVETPPTEDLVRLEEGETFTIPKGHATSIRTKGGWQRGYALADTLVTGPVDISTPTAMSKRDFAPFNTSSSSLFKVLTTGYLVWACAIILFLINVLGPYGQLAVFGGFFGACAVVIFTLSVVSRIMRRKDEKEGLDACPEASPKTFWREDLIWVQSQPIRVTTAG